MRTWMGAALALACFAGFAESSASEGGLGQATSGVTYFNRPGATLEEHQAALERCAPVVRAMSDPNLTLLSGGAAYNAAYSPAANAGAAIVLAIIDSARVSAAMRRAENTHYQNCMVAQGWRLVRLDNPTGRRMSRLRQAQLAEQLGPMIAAAEPEGFIERQFDNELTHVGSVTPIPIGGGNFISLSRLALPESSEAAQRRPGPAATQRAQTPEARAERRRRRELEEEQARASAAQSAAILAEKESNADATDASVAQAATDAVAGGAPADAAATEGTPDTSADSNALKLPELALVTDLTTLPQDATLIVFRQHAAGGGVVFRRVDQNGQEQESFTIGTMSAPPPGPRSDAPTAPLESAKDTITMLAPPGRWRMESMLVGSLTVTLCMGSPAFELAAGDIIYVGDFNFAADPFVPDLTLAPVQEALVTSPFLAQRLHAASYTNGTTGTCGRAEHVYAYEVPLGGLEAARSVATSVDETEVAQPAASPASN